MALSTSFWRWDLGFDEQLHLFNRFGDPLCRAAIRDYSHVPTPEELKQAPICNECYRLQLQRHR